MQQEHASARALDRAHEPIVVQQRNLATRAAKSLDAIRTRYQQQQPGRVWHAEQREIHRQLFTVRATLGRMHMAQGLCATRAGGRDELVSRLGVALREIAGHIHDVWSLSGIAASASAAR